MGKHAADSRQWWPDSGSNQLCYHKLHTASVRRHQPIRMYGNEWGMGTRFRFKNGSNLIRKRKAGRKSNSDGKLECYGDDAWPQRHDGWNPSTMRNEATFTVGQASGARGRVPRPSTGCKTRDQRVREGEEVWLSLSCHKMWEMLLWLIKSQWGHEQRKVDIPKVKLQEFSRRSERERTLARRGDWSQQHLQDL